MRAHQFLREYSREITAQKLGASLLQKFRKEPPQWQARVTGAVTDYDDQALQYLLEVIEKADPTKNKQYVPWIIRNYINNPSLRFEDAITKVSGPLLKFFKLVSKKQIPAPHNDIGRIKDLAQLVQVVDQYPDVEDKVINKGQSKPYYEDGDIRVIIPEDETAACYYGQGTKWCTAAANNNMFNRYNKDGEMYIIIPKKPDHPGEKYQFHFQTKQFMDELDHRANLNELLTRWPQLLKIFASQAKESHVLAFQYPPAELQDRLRQAIPIFNKLLFNALALEDEAFGLEVGKEIVAAVRGLRGIKEELQELAAASLTENGRELIATVSGIIQDSPDIVSDDDQLFDALSDGLQDWMRTTELWLYATEFLEEIEDEEGEFDVAMTFEGELNALLRRLIPELFSQAMQSTGQ